jgi:hypothetical protein
MLRHLVEIIRTDALKNPFHTQWILERSWPNEYARTERIGEKAEDKALSCNILYDLGNKTLAQFLDFPLETDSPEVAQQKQARLMDQPSPAPSPVAEVPPPKVVSKHQGAACFGANEATILSKRRSY